MSLPLRLSNLKPQIEGAPCSPRLVGRTWGRRPHRVSPPARRALCVLRALCALCVKYLSSSVFLRESPRSRPLCVVLSSFPSSPRLSPTKLHRYNSTDMHFCARKCASNHRVFNRVQSHGQLTENKHDQNVYFHTNAHSFRANLLL